MSKRKEPYSVGFGKPPVETRFKPGESGNRKGRPKGAKNLATLVTQIINERVKNLEGESGKSGWRLPSQEIEDRIADIARSMLRDQSMLTETLLSHGVEATLIPEALKIAEDAAQHLAIRPCGEAVFNSWIHRVELEQNEMSVALSLSPLTLVTEEIFISRTVALEIKRRGYELRLVIESEKSTAKIDSTLVKTIARAHCWFEDFARGAVSITEIARREGVGKSYVGDIIRLAFLPPELVESIAEGSQPSALVKDYLIKHPIDLEWYKCVFNRSLAVSFLVRDFE